MKLELIALALGILAFIVLGGGVALFSRRRRDNAFAQAASEQAMTLLASEEVPSPKGLAFFRSTDFGTSKVLRAARHNNVLMFDCAGVLVGGGRAFEVRQTVLCLSRQESLNGTIVIAQTNTPPTFINHEVLKKCRETAWPDIDIYVGSSASCNDEIISVLVEAARDFNANVGIWNETLFLYRPKAMMSSQGVHDALSALHRVDERINRERRAQ